MAKLLRAKKELAIPSVRRRKRVDFHLGKGVVKGRGLPEFVLGDAELGVQFLTPLPKPLHRPGIFGFFYPKEIGIEAVSAKSSKFRNWDESHHWWCT